MTMSLLESLFSQGTMERLGWMLVHVLWQATAVAILLAVFLRLLRNATANIRYGAACSALALMVALPLVTMRYLQTPGPVAEAGPAPVAVVLPAVTEGATPKGSLSVLDSGYAPNPEDTLQASLSVPPVAQSTEPTIPVPLRERIMSALEPVLPYVVLGWLIGVFGLSAWHLGGWTQLQRLKRRMVREIGTPLQRRLEELSARLGLHRAVGLLESALVEVPTVIGWLRPVILLPASALTGLRPEQLEAILAHELAHIRRYDYLVNMLQTVVEILGFYHPAIWWVSRRVRVERENCCDDLAVYVCGSSLQYAKALACMEEIRHGGTDLAVAATGGSLMARIARLLGRPAIEDRRFAWLPGLVTLLLVIGIVIPAAFTLGAGNQPQSSTDTGEDYQALRREHVALLSRPEVQLHEARTAIRLFQKHQDWEELALAYQAAAGAMWRVTHTPAGAFTRPLPPPQPPTGRYAVAEVQTNLDGVWSPSRNDAASWIYWIQGKQKELVLERIETLMKLGGLCRERLGSPARAVEAYQAAGREVPLFEEPLDKLIPRMWPEQTINTGLVLALTVPGAEEIRLRILRALAEAQAATGDLRGAAETCLRAMLASLIPCGGDWHAHGPAREAEAFWQIVRRLPPDQPLPPTLWLDILDRDRPARDFPAPEDAPHGLPYSFPGARLVIRPGQTAQTLTVSADMETPGGSGGVRCFTIIGDNVRHLGTVAWHQDNRPGREWRTATVNVPADAGIIRLEITPYNRSIFHVHGLKVQATFAPAQATSASSSPGDTAGHVNKEGTGTARADVEARNNPDETGQVLLEFKVAKVWSDLRPDRETLLLLANALGVESPLARELGRRGRPLDLTLGEVLKRYVVPQSLSQPATQALIELLQSRGYLTMQAEPHVVAQHNREAQVRTIIDEHFWMPPGSSRLERIAYGTAVDVTPHLTEGNRVALDMMVELTDPVPGVEDSNQPKVSRTSAETSMIAPNDRYLVWAAMEQAAGPMEVDKGRHSLYIMVKPQILQPAPGYAGPAGTPKPANTNSRQILLDVRTVTMERGALLNLGVEWSWPTAKTGVFSGDSTGTNATASNTWPYGVQIGYTADRQFTDSLLVALDVLQENGQARVSGQQILAQDGRQSRIRALTEEWYTVTAPATKQSPQSHTEAYKTESGTVVTITPHVGDNGDIRMTTAIEVSTSLPRARGTALPLITRRTAKNAVTIKDGGTVAVAGMVENRADPDGKSVHEMVIFVTAHLIPDVNEAALSAPQSAEPSTQAPQGATGTNGKEVTVTATFTNTDLRNALAEVSPNETRLIRLNHIKPSQAKQLLSPAFAPYVPPVFALYVQAEPSRARDPNDEGNTVSVTAPPELIGKIVEEIRQIDRPGKQVLLEARVVAIEPNEIPNLGVAWAWPPVRSLLFSSGGKRETQTPLGHLLDRSATDSLMMTLNQLQENGRADIIANPKVVALDGRQAQMKVIEKQWFMLAASQTKDDSPARPELRRLESGTVLAITPHVGDHNDITLVLAVAVNDSLPSSGGSHPSFAARHEITDSITLRDGGTVGVARVVETSPKPGSRRAHVQADIPLLGELFKNRSNDEANRELVVFVTAHLVPDTGRVPLPTAASVETKAQAQKATHSANAEQTPTVDQNTSRAWYIMRQWNCPPLLLGLTQQLAKVLEPSQRNGPAWQEVTSGGTLRLKLDVEGDLPAEVIVGLFQDARWSAPPVTVRRLRAGTHVLTGLPAGQYQIGAMLGNAPLPVALGVQRTWPAPVEIRSGPTPTAEVLVSEAFQKHASGWYNEEVAKDYIGAWRNLDESNLLQGQLTDPGGKPIPFGEIMIREHRTDERGFAAPNRGTNEQGLFKFDEMAWPYRVIARWREPLPLAIGCRYQTMSLNRILEGSQRIDFRFEPFPQGTAKLTGRVLDQKGRPVEGFFLRVLTVSSDQLRQGWEKLDGTTHTYTGYDMPFVSKDGSFDLGGLPEGPACVQVIPFEGRRYEHGGLKDVSLAAGQATSLDFQLTGKDAFYGRVLFEDGTPAVLRPAPWPGAGTRILFARSRTYRAPAVSEVDAQGYFVVYLDEGGRNELASGQLRLSISLPVLQEHRFDSAGEFPADKLSEDRSQAGVVQVKRPASTTPTPTEKPHASDESLATNTPENAKPADSRAWYVMRQANGPPLLLGLTQQLLKVLGPERQNDVMWREVADGGSLQLDVKVERETGREIVVGLFRDAKWSQEPVAVRLLPKEGTYTLTGLPAGRYQIGAMIGRAPSAAALGVQRTWPEAVEVKPGRTTEAQLLVAREFALNASGWYNREVSRDYTGDWSLLKEDHLLWGRLTGPDGQPIRFGEVQVREYRAVRTAGIAAPELGTNEEGVYKFDGMKWPYRVGALWRDPLPAQLGHRYQYKNLNRIFEGHQQVDFQFDQFPLGTAKLAGRAVDQDGNPVTECFLRVKTTEFSVSLRQGRVPDPDGKTYTEFGYTMPFVSADGRFEWNGLPEGPVSVDAIAFDNRRYQVNPGKDVTLEAGKTTSVQVELTRNKLFHGRLLFEDGRPAVVSPAPWEGAKTTLRIDETILFGRPVGHAIRDVAEADAEGWFAVYFRASELEHLRSGSATLRIRLPGKRQDEWQSGGAFPFEKLAEDKAQAGTVTIRPQPKIS